MEEFVGKIWDRFITNQANRQFPEARVELDEIRKTAGIFFRALGGESGLRVEGATDSDVYARRSFLQRIAGTGNKTQYAYRDEQTLRLPASIALFPTRDLNRELYLWLTALSVIPSTGNDWISRNQYRTRKTLQIWPGLKSHYKRLLVAHISLRPLPESLPLREKEQEIAIRSALHDTDITIELTYAHRPPQPVTLWLHPSPPASEIKTNTGICDPDMADSTPNRKSNQEEQKKRKKADRTEMPDGDTGLMSFRLESLFSWAEHSKVDRTTTEEDDDDAIRTAEDMDNITLARDNQTASSKIKLDLDLPSEQYDDIILGEGVALDEWDYKQQRLQKHHCRLQVMQSRDATPIPLPTKLKPQAQRIRRQFEMLRPQRHWLNRQTEGTEIDMENYISFLTDQKLGISHSDVPVYRQLQNLDRDLSCLLLADLSLSTDAYISNEARVVDIIRDSLFLFSEALHATGDRFALHGFSSRNRNHVRFHNIKSFQQPYDDNIRGYIEAIKPGYYTRMGAAIRYASTLLVQQSSTQKLLLILTDGKPNDLDKYEGRYGIEDTRMAVLEAQKMGIQPFCVTIDEKAEEYLPYLFGSTSFMLVRKTHELPAKLPSLYLKLTR